MSTEPPGSGGSRPRSDKGLANLAQSLGSGRSELVQPHNRDEGDQSDDELELYQCLAAFSMPVEAAQPGLASLGIHCPDRTAPNSALLSGYSPVADYWRARESGLTREIY
jgi:hypothetical protein